MIDYSQSPCSKKITSMLINNVLELSFKNLCSTIVAFSGSGKTLELRYLIKNIHLLDNYKQKHLFTFIDLSLLEESDHLAFSEALVFLKNNFSTDLPTDILKNLDDLLAIETVTAAMFLEFVNKLITLDFEITFVIDNSHRLYLNHDNTSKLQLFITSLRRVHSGKVSFIFIAFYEFDNHCIESLKSLSSLFTQNFVHGSDMLLDEESIGLSFSYQEKWNNGVFLPEFKTKVATLCKGDPVTLRIIENRAMSDNTFQKTFIETEDIQKLYELIGKEILDARFKKILKTLADNSINSLENNLQNPTDFLLATGIVVSTHKNGYEAVNVFLSYFLDTFNFMDLKYIDSNKPLKPSPSSSAKSLLTGQEMFVFNLLESKKGEIVSRDIIAKTMWGDASDTKYSDWAIDQVISRIRYKLEQIGYPEKIKTIKGKGFMLKP